MTVRSFCKYCGNSILRRGRTAGVFCNLKCKADWQRLQKPVDKEWLYEKYVVEQLSTYAIARIVKRNPKRVYDWLKDFGIPTRSYSDAGKILISKQGVSICREHRQPKPFWDYEYLYNEYIVKEKSASEIAHEHGCGRTNIAYWLNKLGIPTRNTSQTRRIKEWGVSGPDNPMYGRTGPRNPNWKGGISPERQSFYSSLEWREVAKKVWKRDGAVCQRCGRKKSKRSQFHIHHIVSFAVVELRSDPTNLVLVCSDCHNFIHSSNNTEGLFIGET